MTGKGRLAVKMASKHQIQSLTEDVTCPICLDFFSDPVILECGHNFCRSCITQSWDREERNSCPECREEFADRALKVNRALASIAETARALSLNTGGKESKLHCEEHQEELKLFCETDKKLVCVSCVAAREHKSHSFLPIKEAVERYKELIKTSLEILTKNKSAVGDMEQQQKEKISGVREQSQNLLTYITSVFAELRQILNEKERLFLKDLREEEESVLNPMENNLRAIQEEINSIQEKLLKLQERMNQTDSLIFLKEETRQKRRISDDMHTLSVADGALAVGKYDHPFLLNTVFSEVPDNIKRVSVTLDVETAHAQLEVSEDRKRVRWTRTERSLPDTGKRFTHWWCVLGSEGFTSGRHYWEVEVAGSEGWSLGVAAESVERKGPVTLTPETGVWSIWRRDDEFDAFTSPPSRLPASPIPGRVGVYLSYESGTVSFYDADTKSHLHTFTGNKFTEKLYPFLWTWDKDQWLRICSGSAPVCKRVRSRDRRQERGSGAVGRKPGGQQVGAERLPFNPQIPRRKTPQ
ncbi:zinc-binding protein A33-like [Rhinoraja longicauda]